MRILIAIITTIVFIGYSCKKENHSSIPKNENADYYVSPDGNDTNPGTFDRPWATWQKAFTIAIAGDTVFIRGGIYIPTNEQYGVNISNRSGTEDEPICIFNYPGERPIFNLSALTHSNRRFGIRLYECNYWHIKGLELANIEQPASGICDGLTASYADGIIFEMMTIHDIGGPGININYSSGRNIIKNCDSYNNYDPYSLVPGGNGDGFVTYENSGASYTIIIGCRSWNNSDDGFDCFANDGIVVFDSCWSFNNGYDKGQGDGFKLGKTINAILDEPRRIVRSCIAYKNKYSGFDQNMAMVKMIFYNNAAFFNTYEGFGLCYSSSSDETIIVRNNISFKNSKNQKCFGSNVIHDHNDWNLGITVDGNDFVTIDPAGLEKARTDGGALPYSDFLKITKGSDLINIGIDVGLPFQGAAPDLGPFEKE
jgi:hypothetical protein